MTVETRPIVEPRTKTTADVLRHAALLIEERGWAQGDYEVDGRLCLLGSLNVATDGHSWSTAMLANEACFFMIRGGIGAEWNDEPGRTAAEVTAALRTAADRWEARR